MGEYDGRSYRKRTRGHEVDMSGSGYRLEADMNLRIPRKARNFLTNRESRAGGLQLEQSLKHGMQPRTIGVPFRAAAKQFLSTTESKTSVVAMQLTVRWYSGEVRGSVRS
jgi:hypothetical protein